MRERILNLKLEKEEWKIVNTLFKLALIASGFWTVQTDDERTLTPSRHQSDDYAQLKRLRRKFAFLIQSLILLHQSIQYHSMVGHVFFHCQREYRVAQRLPFPSTRDGRDNGCPKRTSLLCLPFPCWWQWLMRITGPTILLSLSPCLYERKKESPACTHLVHLSRMFSRLTKGEMPVISLFHHFISYFSFH